MSAELRVLYAEDNRYDRELTSDHFAQAAPGIALELVGTGAQCLARLAQNAYDVLLLDHYLPDMDGVAVLRELATRQLELPVVVVTGVGDEELVVQLLGLGACDYMPKQGNYLEYLPAVLERAAAEHRRMLRQRRAFARQRRRILYAEHNPADIDLTS